jgi:hypothetical protein
MWKARRASPIWNHAYLLQAEPCGRPEVAPRRPATSSLPTRGAKLLRGAITLQPGRLTGFRSV